MDAVVRQLFGEFMTHVDDALDGITDPHERLRAFCGAYLDFARTDPMSYEAVFSRAYISALPEFASTASQAFDYLVQAIAEAAGPALSAAEAVRRATIFWATLHGLASLPPAWPRFPWSPTHELVETLVTVNAAQPE